MLLEASEVVEGAFVAGRGARKAWLLQVAAKRTRRVFIIVYSVTEEQGVVVGDDANL